MLLRAAAVGTVLAGCTHLCVARWDFTPRESREWCHMTASGAEWPDAEDAIESSLREQFRRVEVTRTHDPNPESAIRHWTRDQSLALERGRVNELVFVMLFVGRDGGWVELVQRSQTTSFCIAPRRDAEGVELVPLYAGATAG